MTRAAYTSLKAPRWSSSTAVPPPTVSFITGTVGVTTSDSPRSVAVEDAGNAVLSFPVPASGTNPAITPADFSLDSTTTCPQLTSSSSAQATLAVGASCLYAIDYKPSTTAANSGSLILADNNFNAAGAMQTITLNNQGAPVIIQATVNVPPFTTGTANGITPYILPITTDPAGLSLTVTYDNLLGTAPATTTPPTQPGFYLVTAVVNQPGYAGSGSGYLSLSSPQPAPITWANPANITVGTPLSATQLNATSTTPGTFTYSPALGTLLAVGTYPLNVTFVPTDTADYVQSSATVTLVVTASAQTVTPVNFATVNVGTTSTTQTVTFNFANPVTLGSAPVQVSTQGIAGLDFKNTSAGTCAPGNYAASTTCTVTVNFTPAASGPRSGAVVLQDASGNPVATAFIGGIGQGPQIAYDPGVQRTIGPGIVTDGVAIDPAGNIYLNTITSLVKVAPDGTQTTRPTGVVPGFVSDGNMAIDGAGNIYVLDFVNSNVFELTPSGATYQVGSNFKNPADIAIDSAGNLYIVDVNYSQAFGANNGRVVKITPDGVQSVLAGPFVYPEGVAVDAAGNVYISDNAGLGTGSSTPMGFVYKITPGGVVSTLASGLLSPGGVAVDTAGNVFVAGATNSTVARITPVGVTTTFASGLNFPGSLRIDSFGSLYLPHATQNAELVKIDRSTVPSLSFASTAVGSTSADSPQTVTFENIGNADLHLTQNQTTISTNFALDHPTCPIPTTVQGTLASGASCTYPIDFIPTASGSLTGSLTISDDALNVAGSSQIISLSGTGTISTATATITLGNLNQTYTGSPLSPSATTNPTGLTVSFTYNSSATPPTSAGSYTVVATITSTGYTGTATGTLVIAKAAPVITWATPASISYGTTLSGTQLNATASVQGTFTYTSAVGSTPALGTDTLSVAFTPNDTTDYTTATATVSLVVTATAPTITWATPAAITYGTVLSSTQLNATASVPGTFSYSPVVGTILTAGSYSLTATFTPTDTADYSSSTKTVTLAVNPAPLSLTANNAIKVYGTANPSFTGTVSGAQNGDALAESFATTATTLSSVGTYSIIPSVTGPDLSSYTSSVANGSLNIAQAGSTTTFTVGSTSITPGQSVTLTAQVSSATTGVPTGSVQFYDGTTLLNTAALSTGTATYSTTTLSPGATHSLTAVYVGDTNFSGSNGGAAKTVTVSGALDFTITSITASNTVTPRRSSCLQLPGLSIQRTLPIQRHLCCNRTS